MFARHDPTRQTFQWFCELSGATENDMTAAAVRLRDHVKAIRNLYGNPIGVIIPYNDLYFKLAYLVAYFPYYIEPISYVLNAANFPADVFAGKNLKASFFGGGPCPEVLGLAAYLREKAPDLDSVDISVFDRESSWRPVQQVLIPDMLRSYASEKTAFSIHSRQCNVVECPASACSCGVDGSDLIIAQNFLTEIYNNRDRAIQTFESLIRRSGSRYLVFVENNYPQTMELMNDIAAHLYAQGLTVSPVKAKTDKITPNVELPDVLRQHLFTGENGLIAKKNVTYHHMVIEIAR